MQEKINKYINDIKNTVVSNEQDQNNFKNKYLSKKGLLNQLFIEFKKLSNNEKKDVGRL